MATAAAALAVLGTLLTWAFTVWSKWAKQNADPQFQHEARSHEDDEAIARGKDGVDDINRRLADYDLRLPDAPDHGASG